MISTTRTRRWLSRSSRRRTAMSEHTGHAFPGSEEFIPTCPACNARRDEMRAGARGTLMALRGLVPDKPMTKKRSAFGRFFGPVPGAQYGLLNPLELSRALIVAWVLGGFETGVGFALVWAGASW